MTHLFITLICLYSGGMIGTFIGIYFWDRDKRFIWSLIWPAVFYRLYWKEDWNK